MTGQNDKVVMIQDALGSAYRIEALPHPAGAYTFSMWVYAFDDPESTADLSISDMDNNSISTYDDTRLDAISPSRTAGVIVTMNDTTEVFEMPKNEWQRITVVSEELDPDMDAIYVFLDSDCSFYFHRAMLEQGTFPTDWTPAPEDAEEDIAKLTDRVTETEIKLSPDNIVSTVRSSESYRGDLEQIKNETMTTVTQRQDEIENRFTTVETITTENDQYIKKSSAWQRFDADGIHLGKDEPDAEGHKFTVDLSNQELAFNDNGSKVAYINNQTMNITDAKINSRLTIGQFAFIPTDTGMALIYVG